MKLEFKAPTTREIEVNGHKLVATLRYTYDYEQNPVDIDTGSDLEDQKYVARFESGELSNVYLDVTATWLDVEATDSLGACHITSVDAEADMVEIMTSHGMEDEALVLLKTRIIENVETYSKLTIK